jgi:outer membrane biogenesis lipoprotein LolB
MKNPSQIAFSPILRSPRPAQLMLVAIGASVLLSACTTPRTKPATVIDRSRSESTAFQRRRGITA